MANPEHLAILKQGIGEWNRWRALNSYVWPDLRGANLSRLNLIQVNFRQADLRSADLSYADLNWVDLSLAQASTANLTGADLLSGDLSAATFDSANLHGADCGGANFRLADLKAANLSNANLKESKFSAAAMERTNLSGALVRGTDFGNVDLSATEGLDKVLHEGPSTVGIDTIYKSKGKIPEVFLRGCGLSDWEIEAAKLYDPALSASAVTVVVYRVANLRNSQPFQYYSCFISYSTKDQAFADRLYADLRAKGVRCWFAPHDIMGGRKIHEQIDEAIRAHDKLLLILSEHSMASDWVGTEIASAREREAREKKQMLFPITIAPFEEVKQWKKFDADRGTDSAREIREYYIPDFSGWDSDHAGYQREFEKLVGALKAVASSQ